MWRLWSGCGTNPTRQTAIRAVEGSPSPRLAHPSSYLLPGSFHATAPSGLRRRPARTLRLRLGRAWRSPAPRTWVRVWPALSLQGALRWSLTVAVPPCGRAPRSNLLPTRLPRRPRSPPGRRCSRKSRGLSRARSLSPAAPSQRPRLLYVQDRARLPRAVLAPQRASPKPSPVARWPPSLLSTTSCGSARGESFEASPVAASAAGTGGVYGNNAPAPHLSPGRPLARRRAR
jgi:hypothetical protein